MTTTTIPAAALAYARVGWPVHPLQPGGKRPLLPDWPAAATTEPETIRSWWSRWPTANVGIVTGVRSALAVLDIDPRAGGTGSLAELEARVGVLPGSAMVVTGSGGAHLYYRHPGAHVTSRAHSLGPGLDVKGDGGQVVAPPSVHPCGHRYAWCGDVAALLAGDLDGHLAPWPDAQLAVAAPPRRSGPPATAMLGPFTVVPPARARGRRGGPDAVLVGLVDVVLAASEGERNGRLFWAACRAGEHIARGEMNGALAVAALADAARQVGLGDREIDGTLRSAMRPERAA
ncbi:bifunctional DNA primase/polymerase [Frankia sp. R82]|uniref:bifunctional DNA primase/polymerase n=1 Tax=Frankia sp. R82 TaxID=2950553 RepID=UPI002042E17F|nr:bifunctional DNA primase/polymerase [Frankia sp. R82]MCM3886648.1 bifunctional DNA primase/polymerase [Frankia sp. R82]